MSEATTVSNEENDAPIRPHKQLKFATTKEVMQYGVPIGSLQKKVTDPSKKKRKKTELSAQINHLQQHIDTCSDPNQKQMFTDLLVQLSKKKKRKGYPQVLLLRRQT